MRLVKVKIKKYKHLRNVEFNAENTDPKNIPVYFCAGLNGSGKSAFLEAVALIFSRISQNGLPGFTFFLAYELYLEGKPILVTVRPQKKHSETGRLYITAGGEILHSFEGNEKYLPYKIFACITGPNSQMRQLLWENARDSIISDIYDAGMNNQAEQIRSLVGYLEELRNNPRMLFLDEETAVLVLFVLCAWIPQEENGYIRLRSELLRKLENGFYPAALTIVAKGEQSRTSLFSELFNDGKQGAVETDKDVASWVSSDGELIKAIYRVDGDGENFCVARIAKRYISPLTLLVMLLQAKASGEMTECHVMFQRKKDDDLLMEQALSDGELMRIGRMGLVLLARQETFDNCLFLMDEPDVHLNESWNVDFVADIQKLIMTDVCRLHHNFIVATHSSLLLTDAPYNQIFLFVSDHGKSRIRQLPISFFAASRSEISKMMFYTNAEVGTYADQWVEEVLQNEEDPERLYEFARLTGAGIHRFRLLDKYMHQIGE